MDNSHDVVVVGAGVFGAWTAWHLQRAGQRVLLVDKDGPAGPRASSGGETRVIRMAYGADAMYTRMSQKSLPAWTEFFARTGNASLFRQTGVLWLAARDDAAATQSVGILARHDIRHEVLDHDTLLRRYPQIVVPAGFWGLLEPDSGALLARRAVQAVVADAVRAGTQYRLANVEAPAGGTTLARIRTDTGDVIRANRFVFACGPWLGRILPDVLGGRIFPTRQEVFYFGTGKDHRFRPSSLPTWLDFGCGYYGLPDIDDRGFKVARDVHGEAFDPDTHERLPTPARLAHAREFLAQRFPALASAPLLASEVCQYENTWNGDFIIDRHPAFDNVWIVGGGSGHGFKHGPAVGASLAERMLRDAPAEPRFAIATKHAVQKRAVH